MSTVLDIVIPSAICILMCIIESKWRKRQMKKIFGDKYIDK
jgi:hypothetical protein